MQITDTLHFLEVRNQASAGRVQMGWDLGLGGAAEGSLKPASSWTPALWAELLALLLLTKWDKHTWGAAGFLPLSCTSEQFVPSP